MHLIWLSLVIPSMFLIAWATPAARRPGIWALCLGIILSVLVVIVGVDVAQFIATSKKSAANDGGVFSRGAMRALFSMITMTNIPLLASAAGSCLNWIYSRRWQATLKENSDLESLASAAPDTAEQAPNILSNSANHLEDYSANH